MDTLKICNMSNILKLKRYKLIVQNCLSISIIALIVQIVSSSRSAFEWMGCNQDKNRFMILAQSINENNVFKKHTTYNNL